MLRNPESFAAAIIVHCWTVRADIRQQAWIYRCHTWCLISNCGVNLQVASQINTFLLAGYETTASALAFTVYHVARSPDKEAKLLAEIDAFGRGRAPTLEELDQVGSCTASRSTMQRRHCSMLGNITLASAVPGSQSSKLGCM
jgi:Cytochrome P450